MIIMLCYLLYIWYVLFHNCRRGRVAKKTRKSKNTTLDSEDSSAQPTTSTRATRRNTRAAKAAAAAVNKSPVACLRPYMEEAESPAHQTPPQNGRAKESPFKNSPRPSPIPGFAQVTNVKQKANLYESFVRSGKSNETLPLVDESKASKGKNTIEKSPRELPTKNTNRLSSEMSSGIVSDGEEIDDADNGTPAPHHHAMPDAHESVKSSQTSLPTKSSQPVTRQTRSGAGNSDVIENDVENKLTVESGINNTPSNQITEEVSHIVAESPMDSSEHVESDHCTPVDKQDASRTSGESVGKIDTISETPEDLIVTATKKPAETLQDKRLSRGRSMNKLIASPINKSLSKKRSSLYRHMIRRAAEEEVSKEKENTPVSIPIFFVSSPHGGC